MFKAPPAALLVFSQSHLLISCPAVISELRSQPLWVNHLWMCLETFITQLVQGLLRLSTALAASSVYLSFFLHLQHQLPTVHRAQQSVTVHRVLDHQVRSWDAVSLQDCRPWLLTLPSAWSQPSQLLQLSGLLEKWTHNSLSTQILDR